MYTEDAPKMNNEVFGAFVLSTAIGNIVKIDASEALVRFLFGNKTFCFLFVQNNEIVITELLV